MKAREADKAIRQILNVQAHNDRADLLEKKKKDAEKRPPIVERITEYVLIRVCKELPEEEWPAAIAAIKYYIHTAQQKAAAWSSMRPNYKRELTLHVHLLVSELGTHLSKTFFAVLDLPMYSAVDYLPRPISDYDMYFAFDEKVISSFRDNKKFHAASAYGILLGCEAQSMYDIPVNKITEKVTDKVPSDILVIDDALFNYKALWQHIGQAVPELTVSRVVSYMNLFPAMIAAIQQTKVVVGPLSQWTYWASCMGKAVYEIYPPTLSKAWLSKWSNKKYVMYVGTPNALDYDTILKGVGTLWALQDHLYKQQARLPQTEETQMEQSPFSV